MSWFTRGKLYLSLKKALLRNKVLMGILVQKHEWGISTWAFVVLSVIFDAFPPAYLGSILLCVQDAPWQRLALSVT